MGNTANKTVIPRHSAAPQRTVIYRGVKIVPMTGKRSPLAEMIRKGLWSKSARPLSDPPKA